MKRRWESPTIGGGQLPPRSIRGLGAWTFVLFVLAACSGPLLVDDETATMDATLFVSLTCDASAQTELDGEAVAGTVHVVVEAGGGVKEVRFHLDGAPDPIAVETERPFELILETGNLSDGWHVIDAFAPSGKGGRVRLVASATFEVVNAPHAEDPPVDDPCPPTSPVPGAEWFLAPWGSDQGEGSWEDPFASLLAASEVASPGDAIWLRGGVYDRVGENVYYDFTLYGTADAPITIRSYPGERAILDGAAHPYHPRTYGDGYSITDPNLLRMIGDHVVLEDITLRHGVGIGLSIIGYHNVVRRVQTHHHHSIGLYLQGSYNLLEYIEAFDNNSVANGGNSANGIALIDGAQIRTTRGPDAETRGNVVRYALLYRNSDDGIGTRGLDTLIEHSVAFDNGIGPTGNGRGFKLGGDDRQNTGTVVRFNIAFGNYINYDTNGSTGVTLHHNTSFDATSIGFVLTRYATGLSANVAHNNVSYRDETPRARGDDTVDTYNTWNLGITEPRFLSLDPTSPDFLALRTDSPLIDAGVDLGFDFAGSTPDLGALQLHERWTHLPSVDGAAR